MISTLARVGDLAYASSSAVGGDAQRGGQANNGKTTVVENTPDPWIAVRVEIVARDPARAAASAASLDIGYDGGAAGSARYLSRTRDEAVSPEPAVLTSTLARSQSQPPPVAANRIGASDAWRAIAAYTAQAGAAQEQERSTRAGQRLHVRA